jgi:hypothetical protein
LIGINPSSMKFTRSKKMLNVITKMSLFYLTHGLVMNTCVLTTINGPLRGQHANFNQGIKNVIVMEKIASKQLLKILLAFQWFKIMFSMAKDFAVKRWKHKMVIWSIFKMLKDWQLAALEKETVVQKLSLFALMNQINARSLISFL